MMTKEEVVKQKEETEGRRDGGVSLIEGEEAERRWHAGGQTEKWSLSDKQQAAFALMNWCQNKTNLRG